MSSTTIDPKTLAVLDKLELEAQNKGVSEELILIESTGVILKWHSVPPLLMSDIVAEYPEPPVPTVYDEDNDKHIANPNDPQYLRDIEDRDRDLANAITDVLLAMGTTVKHLPEGMEPVDSDDWLDTASIFLKDKKIPTSGKGRYLSWLKYVAINDKNDLDAVAVAIQKFVGVTYQEVQEAADGFPDNSTQ